MSVQVTVFSLAIVTLFSSGVHIFAAVRLWPERKSSYGRVVFYPMVYNSFFWLLVSGIMFYGATLGTISVILPPTISLVAIILYLLKHAATDRLALVAAGIIKL